VRPDGPPQGNVLISHLIAPLVLKPGQPLLHSHTHLWQARQIVQTFLDLGYKVDAINCTNNTYSHQKLRFFSSMHNSTLRALPRFSIKIVSRSSTVKRTRILFHNAIGPQRLLGLYQRKGITLSARRWEQPNKATEYAHYINLFGNDFTLSTYQHTNKPIYRLPSSMIVLLPSPERKDFDACRNSTAIADFT
jgi:hypothetical protein